MDATTLAASGVLLEHERAAVGADFAAQLLGATRVYGKSYGAMVREIAKLAFGPGKVSPQEYFDYRLFDDQRLDLSAKLRFAGVRAQQRIAVLCNTDPTYIGAVRDKLLFAALMRGLGLPVEPSLAVYGGTSRARDLIRLQSPEDLRHFFADADRFPMFGKPVNGRQSLGVVALDRYDPVTDELIAGGERRVPFRQFSSELEPYRAEGYLFQRRLAAHPDLARLHGPRIATVRTTTGFGPEGPEVLFGAWKIPAGDNLADNFWRRGNLLASLDPMSGRVERVVRGVGLAQEEINDHPDTGMPLRGLQLPFWTEIHQLSVDAAGALSHLRLLGWDIAVGADGPLLLEANHCPALALHQYPSGQGVFNERFEAFLGFCATTAGRRR